MAQNIDELIEQLSASTRRKRQDAAHAIAVIAAEDPAPLMDRVDDLVDALERPEAQTRWEILNALNVIGEKDPSLVAGAEDAAEASLFDEDSSSVRLAAFRFLVDAGKVAPEASVRVWPLLDEAAQCFHGDPEYREMLLALQDFARGDIDPEVRGNLVERVSFDAQSNARGFIKTYSAQIVEAAKEAEEGE